MSLPVLGWHALLHALMSLVLPSSRFHCVRFIWSTTSADPSNANQSKYPNAKCQVSEPASTHNYLWHCCLSVDLLPVQHKEGGRRLNRQPIFNGIIILFGVLGLALGFGLGFVTCRSRTTTATLSQYYPNPKVPFKCYVTLLSRELDPTHPFVTLTTFKLTPS